MTPTMPSLTELAAAMQHGDTAFIRAYCAQCDVESGNQLRLDASARLRCLTHLVMFPPAHGQRLGLGRDLASLMDGSSDTSSLPQLLRLHERPPLLTLAGCEAIGRSLLRTRFALKKYTGKATLFPWEPLVFAGLPGTPVQAKVVRDSLPQQEQRARVSAQGGQDTGLTPRHRGAERLQV